MRKVTERIATNPSTIAMLEQIQEQINDVCEPQYHEFHRVTTERGFTKITIPKRRAVG